MVRAGLRTIFYNILEEKEGFRMLEHTIPESLVDKIKNGKVVLVVGAGLGIATWKNVLEKMNEHLAKRDEPGDAEASKDVGKLLTKGAFAPATSFLGRVLGQETCDSIIREHWSNVTEMPEVASALGKLPIRTTWTTFPGDLLTEALRKGADASWPDIQVFTYADVDKITSSGRNLVKILGGLDNYVVTPQSIRRVMSGAETFKNYAREHYHDTTLLLVGFRHGDPDLTAVLDRIFGQFPLPTSNHYLVASGIGPVAKSELESEHHIEVINLEGKGADQTAQEAFIGFIEDLVSKCDGAGINDEVPDASDTEGWLDWLARNPGDATALNALSTITEQALADKNWDTAIASLLGRLEHATDQRGSLWLELADAYEGADETENAFEALTAAIDEDPTQTHLLDRAEKLADQGQLWTDLIADISEIASGVKNKNIASVYWSYVGDWYGRYGDRPDYAASSLKQALRLDPDNHKANTLLADSLRKVGRWVELADHWESMAGKASTDDQKVDLYLSLGELYEGQLASTPKAAEAYENAAKFDSGEDSLVALEHLYRGNERFGKLQDVLKRRLDIIGKDDSRAVAINKEIAALASGQTKNPGDAIQSQEAVLSSNPEDIGALKQLEQLYDNSGDTSGYISTLERIASAETGEKRIAALRKLGAELEASERIEESIERYKEILDTKSDDVIAFSQIERLLREKKKWYDLVEVYEQHISVADASEKLDLHKQVAELYENELDDPHRAIEFHLNVVGERSNDKESIEALGRLYERTESWERAAETLSQAATFASGTPNEALYWGKAGISARNASAKEEARVYLEKALALAPRNLEAARALADLHIEEKNWASAIQTYVRCAESIDNTVERTALLNDAAELASTELIDEAQALELRLRILERDPENLEAGQLVAPQLQKAGRLKEALPILEMLARKETDDRLERSRLYASLGATEQSIGTLDRAAAFFRKAVEADLDNLDAAVGLADCTLKRAENAKSEELYREADKSYRQVLARHRGALPESTVAGIWFNLGEISTATGDKRKAESSYRRALELDSHHLPTIDALVAVASEKGDWKTVIDAKRELLETQQDEAKADTYEAIGDLYAKKLNDPVSALSAYQEAKKHHSKSRVLLHKLLDIYQGQKQWRRAVEVIAELAMHADSKEHSAKYNYTAAVIARDKLNDRDLAVEQFNLCLDNEHDHDKALAGIDGVLSSSGDYRQLARSYRKMLKRIGDEGSPERLLALWSRLGDICANHLEDKDAGIAAYEVAASLAPQNTELHETLVELYLSSGEERRDDAIDELQVLLKQNPDRAELYRALSNLYREAGEVDKAYCLAQALAFLNSANTEEKQLIEKFQAESLKVASRRLTEELWQKAILHQEEDRHVSAVFGAIGQTLANSSAKPAAAYNLSAQDKLEAGSSKVSKLTNYAKEVLGLEIGAQLFATSETEGEIKVANTTDGSKLSPSLLLPASYTKALPERELVFHLAKRLSYFRKERYVNYALQTVPTLEAAFEGALVASGAKDVPTDAAAQYVGKIQGLPQAILDQVCVVGKPLKDELDDGLVTNWQSATDLSANRIGLILCDDLETAAKAIAVEKTGLSGISKKDRLRDLLAYAVSEEYFTVRRHLGLSVE